MRCDCDCDCGCDCDCDCDCSCNCGCGCELLLQTKDWGPRIVNCELRLYGW